MRAIFLCFLLIPMAGFSQEDAQKKVRTRPPFTLKVSPAGPINVVQQALVFHGDIPFSTRWGLDWGAGIVYNSITFANYKGETFRGIKLRPAIKYYLKQSDQGGIYVSLLFKYNNLTGNRYVNTIRQGGQYTEWRKQKRHLVTTGAAFMVGGVEYFGTKKRWFIEPFFGLGMRQVRITLDDLPPDAELVRQGFFFDFERDPGIYNFPDVMMGFYIGRTIGGTRSQ